MLFPRLDNSRVGFSQQTSIALFQSLKDQLYFDIRKQRLAISRILVKAEKPKTTVSVEMQKRQDSPRLSKTIINQTMQEGRVLVTPESEITRGLRSRFSKRAHQQGYLSKSLGNNEFIF